MVGGMPLFRFPMSSPVSGKPPKKYPMPLENAKEPIKHVQIRTTCFENLNERKPPKTAQAI